MFDDFVEHAGSSSPGLLSPPAEFGASSNSLGSGSGTSNGNAVRSTMINQTQYEGFEVDDDANDRIDSNDDVMSAAPPGMEAIETGYYPHASSSSSSSIFSLSHVQFSLPNALLCLQVNSNILVMAVHPLSLILLDLSRPADLVHVDLPKPSTATPTAAIRSIWGDPSGRHLLVATQSGDAFYLSTGNLASTHPRKPPRPLRLRHPIACVAWSPNSPSTTTNVDCLLGSSTGAISTLTLPPSEDMFNINLKSLPGSRAYERDHAIVLNLPDNLPVTGLEFGFWEGATASGGSSRQAWIVVTSRDRMWEMHGPAAGTSNMAGRGGWAEEVFRPYREHLTTRSNTLTPTAIAWSTGSGLYTSAIPLTLSASGTIPDVFSSPRLLDYPQGHGIAIDFCLTEFHYVYLFPRRIVAVSRLTDALVWDEALPLKVDEKPVGLAADPVHATFWCYTDRALHEVVVQDEDRHVWRAKLDKSEFDTALAYAKTPAQIDLVRSRQADHLFDQAKYMQAARVYAKCSRSFEYVALRFFDADERDALRMYLADRLHRMPTHDLTQRMMLATWLIEIYLSKCNTLEDIIAAEAATSDVESMRVELQLMGDDLRNFITTYQANLDREVMYDMILSHGRTDIYLFYAGLVRDHKAIVEHWVREEDWRKAIDQLSRQDDVELYYRFATVLVAHQPAATVDSWLKQPALDVRRLVPALLLGQPRESIRFLRQIVVASGSTDAILYNLLIMLLARESDESQLIDFLSTIADDPIAERPYYDLDYALRTCKNAGRIRATVYIYSRMGLYENSVDLALQQGDLELAKINADKVEDDDDDAGGLRRKLWLKIAKYVVQEKGDIKSAMQFLETSSDLLRIEDILPFFPDFAVIDDFKDEICKALEDYQVNIESLKAEMDEATRSAESIKLEIAQLQNRFMTVDISERCTHCQQLLMTRPFYVFPCQHVFHVDCLIKMAKEYLSAPTLRRIVHLQNELISLAKHLRRVGEPTRGASGSSKTAAPNTHTEDPSGDDAATASLLGLPTSRNRLLAAGDKIRELVVPDALASAVSAVAISAVGGGSSSRTNKSTISAADPKDQARMERLRGELDRLLASSCVLCEGSVVTLDKGFITTRDGDDGSWDI